MPLPVNPDITAEPFPFPTQDEQAHFAKLAWLRRHAPISPVTLRSGHTAWLLTRYQDVRRVLTDRRFSAAVPDGGPSLSPWPFPSSVPIARNSDPPVHTRLRKAITSTFSAREVSLRLRLIQAEVDRLLDAVTASGPPGDLHRDFAWRLPLAVQCAWLDAPHLDQVQLLSWKDELIEPETPDAARRAGLRACRFAADELAAHRMRSDDHLYTKLLTTPELSEQEQLGLALTLLFAAHTTTSSLITSSLRTLLEDPQRYARLRENPTEVPVVVEELLRHLVLIKDGTLRIATEDLSLGDVSISAGEAVVLSLNAANRDEAVFTDGDTLDLTLVRKPHLTFGHGIHRCPFAHVVRAQTRIALTTVMNRFPTLRLDHTSRDLEWQPRLRLRALAHLPVVW